MRFDETTERVRGQFLPKNYHAQAFLDRMEQEIRSVLDCGSGCLRDRQRVEVHGIRGAAVKGGMQSSSVEEGVDAPHLPKVLGRCGHRPVVHVRAGNAQQPGLSRDSRPRSARRRPRLSSGWSGPRSPPPASHSRSPSWFIRRSRSRMRGGWFPLTAKGVRMRRLGRSGHRRSASPNHVTDPARPVNFGPRHVAASPQGQEIFPLSESRLAV